MMHERTRCPDEAANHQLPIAVGFWIRWIVSPEEYSRLMQNLCRFVVLLSVILNAMATQYTCSFNGIYHLQWLVQWSHHWSHMHIPVHSPWLPGHINIAQDILITLTMARLFLDRLYTHIQGLAGNSPALVSITTTVCTTSVQPGSQGEWTGMHMHEQWWLHCIVSGGNRHHWVSMSTVWPKHSK